ncbi:5-hydroxytryptamine receptor 3A [Stigmatopora nigra]
MKLPAIVLILSGLGVSSQGNVCSFQDVVDHLNLTVNNRALRLTRPVLDHRRPTLVELNLILYGILGVIEKTQTFIPFFWLMVSWTNERIFWDPDQFCGINEIDIPVELLWKPDIMILEMVEKDDSQPNLYLHVDYNGTIVMEQNVRAVSMCMLDVYKFPFDTQRCNISLTSAILEYKDLQINAAVNSSRATEFSKNLLYSQGEWEFLQLSVRSQNISLENKMWGQLVYTFVVQRRPLMHVINFLLPILFFLVLDLASFFIPDHHGEKLGFKVTVMLAISVLLLILNDILPSMSNRMPLIATYCIVIFGLMLLSLLETIFVSHLSEKDTPDNLLRCCGSQKEKDSADKSDTGTVPSENAADALFLTQQVCSIEGKQVGSSVTLAPGGGKKRDELLPEAGEANSVALGMEPRLLLLIVDELKQLQRMLDMHLSNKKEVGKCSRLGRKINQVFFWFYLATATLFITTMFLSWAN